MCVIDRNTANGPNLMLPFTDAHWVDVKAKTFAPNIDAPQTEAYFAFRIINYCTNESGFFKIQKV